MTVTARAASAVAGLLLAAGLAACGEGGSSSVAQAEEASEAAAPASPKRSKRTTRVRLQDSDYGRVLFDSKGGALYLFTLEGRGKSRCYGECAEEWPPFYARGRLRAGEGVDQKKLGRTKRKGGRSQVTYAGHPLYYWYNDPPNQILCHDVFEFGGDWLVVKASGRPAD